MSDGLTPHFLPDWYESALASLDFPLGWKGGDPASWRRQGVEAVTRLLLESQAPGPDAEVLGSEARDGYRVDLLSLNLGRFRRSRAYRAVPEGPGPFPAVLILHDHGAFFEIGAKKMVKPFAEDRQRAVAEAWAEKNYEGRFLVDEWARAGWVALTADALGWGERTCGAYENQQAVAANLFNLGSSWAGVIAVEDQAAAAYLASLPFVDRDRVAALGHSMGGYRSYQVAALSDHIRSAVAVCCLGTHRGLMAPGGNRTRGQSAFTTTHPGLSRLMDFPDLAALAAPKPLMFLHGVADTLFPEASARDACDRVAAVYQAWGHPERFQSVYRPGGHVFSLQDQALAASWLARG